MIGLITCQDASIPNTGRGLGTRSGAIYFGSNNINNSQRNTPPTTVVATQSSVPQKVPTLHLYCFYNTV